MRFLQIILIFISIIWVSSQESLPFGGMRIQKSPKILIRDNIHTFYSIKKQIPGLIRSLLPDSIELDEKLLLIKMRLIMEDITPIYIQINPDKMEFGEYHHNNSILTMVDKGTERMRVGISFNWRLANRLVTIYSGEGQAYLETVFINITQKYSPLPIQTEIYTKSEVDNVALDGFGPISNIESMMKEHLPKIFDQKFNPLLNNKTAHLFSKGITKDFESLSSEFLRYFPNEVLHTIIVSSTPSSTVFRSEKLRSFSCNWSITIPTI